MRQDGRLPAGVFWLAAFDTGIHLATAGRYGIFRDELYYVACARHLAWGYVDHPPLIAFVAWIVIHTLGTTLLALRLLPAIAGGALVILTACVARELGGGRTAQNFAAFSIVPVPIYLILHHWLTMNAFEPLLWTGVLLFALKMINENESRNWVWIGLLAGIGFETKYTMLFCLIGLFFGLAVTQERHRLRSPWLWAGVACATVVFLPNVLWLWIHDFPFLEFERHSRESGSRIALGPAAFVADQMLIMNPLLAPLWIGGLVWLFCSTDAARYRWIGCACLSMLLLLLVLQAKNYYVAPMYPTLFAAGAIGLERFVAARRWIGACYGTTVAMSGCVLAPLVMPILSPDVFLRYSAELGGLTPVKFENLPAERMPQHFADEFGWEDMARNTAAVYTALPPQMRASTAIFANNYGEAAAIDFFGPRFGLPPSISNHESYWLWGPRDFTGATVIVLGSDGKGDRAHFRTVDAAATVGNPYARNDEQFTIFVCHDLVQSFDKLWPSLRKW